MQQYHDLIKHVLANGTEKSDRTGTGITSVFGHQMRFDLADGFPLLTTKKVHYPAIIHELLWFLSGSTSIDYLKQYNVKIWDSWATESNEIGPLYGSQWTSWQNPDGTSTNQIQQAVDLLRSNPDSRRIIVSAWNPSDLPDESISPQANVANGKMALAACHAFFQFYTTPMTHRQRIDWLIENSSMEIVRQYRDHVDRAIYNTNMGITFDYDKVNTEILAKLNVPTLKLSCQLYQRSADVFLGVPFNIASYALLVHMMAQQCNMDVGEFIWTGGDTHIYSNHFDQVKLQLTREPKSLPTLKLNRKPDSIFDYKFEDFTISNYNPDPLIKGAVAV